MRLGTAVILLTVLTDYCSLLSTHCLLQVSPCCQLVVVELRAAKGLVVAAWCWDKEAQVCRYRHLHLDILTWISYLPGYPHLDICTWISTPGYYLHPVSPVQESGCGPLELEGELAVTSDHTELVAVARCGNIAKLRLPV